MDPSIALLDRYYAETLGCRPEDLNAGRIVVVEHDLHSVWYAKGTPLALYALAKPEGAVVSVRPGLLGATERAVGGATALDDTTWGAIQQAVSPLIEAGSWFRGVRLYCDEESFAESASGGVGSAGIPETGEAHRGAAALTGAGRPGEVREINPEEEKQSGLPQRRWGGKVFGQVIDGVVVSRAAVKPLSDTVWDLSISTHPAHRGRGYARNAVAAAVRHVLADGRLVGWGCEHDHHASLAVARAVGFKPYALDFGCVERGHA